MQTSYCWPKKVQNEVVSRLLELNKKLFEIEVDEGLYNNQRKKLKINEKTGVKNVNKSQIFNNQIKLDLEL